MWCNVVGVTDGRECLLLFAQACAIDVCFAGRCGELCSKADGRELWLLSEMYNLQKLMEYLAGEGIHQDSVCAAYQFCLLPEGVERKPIRDHCIDFFSVVGLEGVGLGSLRLVGADVITLIAHARIQDEEVGGHQWSGIKLGFQFVQTWVAENGNLWQYVQQGREIVEGFNLMKLPLEVLQDLLQGGQLLSVEQTEDILKSKIAAGNALGGQVYREVQDFRRPAFGPGRLTGNVLHVAVHGEGEDQVLVVVDAGNCIRRSVLMFDVQSGMLLATLGWRDGPGSLQVLHPSGVCFTKDGDVYVADCGCVRIYDRSGRYRRTLPVAVDGQALCAGALVSTYEGDVVIADLNHDEIVQFTNDRCCIGKIGAPGDGHGSFVRPKGMCIGKDHSICVVDSGNHRVVVFDRHGSLSRTVGSHGAGPGQFLHPFGVYVGARGEMVVSDCIRNDVQVFSSEGELLQTIGSHGDSKVHLGAPTGVAVDGQGRVFVAVQGGVVMLSGK